MSIISRFLKWFKKELPNSEKCIHRELDENGAKVCIPCAKRGCQGMFGTDLCRYHYKAKKGK